MRFNLFSRPSNQSFGRKSPEERLHRESTRRYVPPPPAPAEPAPVPATEPVIAPEPAAPAATADRPAAEPSVAAEAVPAHEGSPAGRGADDVLEADGMEERSVADPPAAEVPAPEARPAAPADSDLPRVRRPWPPVNEAADETPMTDAAPAPETAERPSADFPGSLAAPAPGPDGSRSPAARGFEPAQGDGAWQAPDRAGAPAPVHEVEEEPDELEDVAVTIGRVVSIRGAVVWGALFDDTDGMAAKAARMGALVSMRGPESRVFGIVNALQRDQAAASGNEAERTMFEIQVLGEIMTAGPDAGKGFQRGVSSYPPLDAPITTVTLRDLATVYARPRASSVHIGRLRHNRKVPAFVLTDNLLGKHFAVLGTTGTGKSCAVTVILRSILDAYPKGHIVLLDPHNEYASAFSDKAELLSPANLQLPYWLLNFEEIAHILVGGSENEYAFAQRTILKEAILRAREAYAGETDDLAHLTIDTPVPYRLSDLISAIKEAMGSLNKTERAAPYLSLVGRLESLRVDRRFAFMFGSLAVRDTMEGILAQLLRIPVEGKPITIMDISGVPSEIVDVVVSVLFRLIFELATWSERGAAPPVLLVCEEAHRYVPEDDTLGFAPTKRVISRIAKEGRKYGVTLCLVSQRPSELAVSSLSQCNTVFALRLSNEHDQGFVARALPENARWLVDGLPSLNTQEAVVVGDGVTVPVHIRFSDLDPRHRPSSHDPSFSQSWQEDRDPAFLGRAIERWRKQLR